MHYVNVISEKCRKCGYCEDVCPTGAIQRITPEIPWVEHHIPDPAYCVNCGQCLKMCSGGAIYDCISHVDTINEKIADPATTTIAMIAPAIRYSLAHEFGMEAGSFVGGKLVAALKQLGFDHVWDIEFAADVTIMEESAELLARMEGIPEKPLPMFTSCCPAWIKYVETYYPQLIPHISTTRSPVQILGVLAKTYGAGYIGTDMAGMFTTSIMPCIAKKFEADREENVKSGVTDCDATITTRELITMIRTAGIDFASLPDEEADPPFQTSTGAATIFCASGGVMEAALRRVYEQVTGDTLDQVDFTEIRGREGLREATIDLDGATVRLAIVNGLSNAAAICESVSAGESPYDIIEVMACPDGCINGGGQPYDGWDDGITIPGAARTSSIPNSRG